MKRKNEKWNNRLNVSILISGLLHFILIFSFANLEMDPTGGVQKSDAFVQFDWKELSAKSIVRNTKERIAESVEKNDDKKLMSADEEYLNPGHAGTDTTLLGQIYSESSLNVKIKYPAGWQFLDQNLNKKLEGVTFWQNNSEINPPPYVHLEVVEKDLFNPDRYKYRKEFSNFTAYYNDPVELANQVSQTVYLRTDWESDFSIKLIIKGEREFALFQPRFFGMISTLKFGSNFIF